MRLTIGFDGYPLQSQKNFGPDVFMRRLGESILAQHLAHLVSPKQPDYDMGLFKITAPNTDSRPFILRNGGIYFDSDNTVGDTDTLNAPIFASIDRTAGMVFISEFARKLVESFYHPLAIPSMVIHNAVDTRHFCPTGHNYRDQLSIVKNEVVFITAAKWRRWKRLQETVTLFKLFQEQNKGHPCKLLVLGDHPDYVMNDPDILYTGAIPPENLPAWYRTGDVYIHLATLEICGNTQIEAIACGLPVICTNNGGIGETIRSANAGIVSAADPEFTFEKVAHYHPAAPDYHILLEDIQKLLYQYQDYKNNIRSEAVSIDDAARKYVRFITDIFSRHLVQRYAHFPYTRYRFRRSLRSSHRFLRRMAARLLQR